jgi:hypothetical protein
VPGILMKLEKEYRYIYGVWQYVEMILHELNARIEDVKVSGSENDKLVRTYDAKLPNAVIKAEVVYERKSIHLLSNGFGKIAHTNVRIEASSDSSDVEEKVIQYFSDRLTLYTLRGAG